MPCSPPTRCGGRVNGDPIPRHRRDGSVGCCSGSEGRSQGQKRPAPDTGRRKVRPVGGFSALLRVIPQLRGPGGMGRPNAPTERPMALLRHAPRECRRTRITCRVCKHVTYTLGTLGRPLPDSPQRRRSLNGGDSMPLTPTVPPGCPCYDDPKRTSREVLPRAVRANCARECLRDFLPRGPRPRETSRCSLRDHGPGFPS